MEGKPKLGIPVNITRNTEGKKSIKKEREIETYHHCREQPTILVQIQDTNNPKSSPHRAAPKHFLETLL